MISAPRHGDIRESNPRTRLSITSVDRYCEDCRAWDTCGPRANANVVCLKCGRSWDPHYLDLEDSPGSVRARVPIKDKLNIPAVVIYDNKAYVPRLSNFSGGPVQNRERTVYFAVDALFVNTVGVTP